MEWLIGGVAAGLAVLALALLMPRRRCPDCGEPFPRCREPASRKQAMSGGATCAKCGCEVDRLGRKVESE
jgi:hypothetical protein